MSCLLSVIPNVITVLLTISHLIGRERAEKVVDPFGSTKSGAPQYHVKRLWKIIPQNKKDMQIKLLHMQYPPLL